MDGSKEIILKAIIYITNQVNDMIIKKSDTESYNENPENLSSRIKTLDAKAEPVSPNL